MKKATVTLGGVELTGVGAIEWRLQTGTQPYTTVVNVHNTIWKSKLKNKTGQKHPHALKITDSRGVDVTVRSVYITQVVPSGKPSITSFELADRRYWWPYRFISRDYNTTRKSGDRTRIGTKLVDIPLPGTKVWDIYNFKPYSLRGGATKWTPEEAVEDCLEMLEGGDKKHYIIESFPIAGGSADGQFTLQNVMLRDQGDVALARLLSYIPASAVYVDLDGMVRVIDGADLQGMEAYHNTLPPPTWDGDKAEFVDRKAIRPAQVAVHYQREVECVFEFVDSIGTVSGRGPNDPFLENVIPTVDPVTTFKHRDPDTGELFDHDVAAGTWEEFHTWLAEMNRTKPAASWDWTFQTISEQWVYRTLPGILRGNPGFVEHVKDDEMSAPMRIAALMAHFRQTFRINPRYMDRIRDIMDYRVAVLDPVSATRAASAVWGEMCLKPTNKGVGISHRRDGLKDPEYINITTLPEGNNDLITASPGPAEVVFRDRDQGIFSVKLLPGSYATVEEMIPCHLVGANGQLDVPHADLAKQDTTIMGPGFKIAGGNNGLFLKNSMRMKVMVTIVPGAPNNKKQFHAETVKASDISDLFRKEYRIQGGDGPTLEVFIPPTETTARFQWVGPDADAKAAVVDLLGLNSDEPNDAGLRDDPKTPKVDEANLESRGFLFSNPKEITNHAKAVTAEVLAAFADNVQGHVATVLPARGLKLKGNMGAAAIRVGGYPSAKVDVVHEFPGQAKPVSRLALMDESTRQLVLRIVRVGDEG